MRSSEENVYPRETILLWLLYYIRIQLQLCVGAIGASYKCCFDLSIIYFHISMSVFPQESPVSGPGILWQCRCYVKKGGSGIYHFSSACRFTFEGLKKSPKGGWGGKELFFFSSYLWVQFPNKDSSFLLSKELCDLILLLALVQISQPIFMHSAFLMKSTCLKSIKPLFSFLRFSSSVFCPVYFVCILLLVGNVSLYLEPLALSPPLGVYFFPFLSISIILLCAAFKCTALFLMG